MAKITTVLYKSKILKNGTHPIMFRIHNNGKNKYFKCGGDQFNVRKDQWDQALKLLKKSKKVNPDHENLNLFILQKQNELQELILEFEKEKIAWTFNMLEERFKYKPKTTNFSEYTTRLINTRHKNSPGTSENYKQLLNDVQTIVGAKKFKDLQISDIDYDFVTKMLDYAREEIIKKGLPQKRWSDGHIRTRISMLSAILTQAIKDNCGSPKTFPFNGDFGATKYVEKKDFKSSSRNKYIPSKLLEKFKNYTPYWYEHMLCIKVHLFCAHIPGLNYIGAARIKKSNLESGTVLHLNVKDHGINGGFEITDKMSKILNWISTYMPSQNDYLFPIITDENINDLEEKRKRKNNILDTLRKKYKIKDGQSIQIERWEKVKIWRDSLRLNQKLFLFSYYAQGMNFRDMAYLSTDDIKTNYDSKLGDYKFFTFYRKKTNSYIEVQISDEIAKLLNWFKENYPPYNKYLLPIISESHLANKEMYTHIDKARRRMNIALKKIAEECDFPEELRDIHGYFARHTYASTLRAKNAPIEIISEALGHKNLQTTKTYLKSFEANKIGIYNKML